MLQKGTPSIKSQPLGEAIRRLRDEKGLSQSWLAEKAKISKTYLWQLEHEISTPTIDVLKRIADALNVSVSEILGEEVKASSPALQLPFPGSIFQLFWDTLHRLPDPEQKEAFAEKVVQVAQEIESQKFLPHIDNLTVPRMASERVVITIIVPILEYQVMQPSVISEIPKLPNLFYELGKHGIESTTSRIRHTLPDISPHIDIKQETIDKISRLLQAGGVKNIISVLDDHYEILDVTAKKGYQYLVKGIEKEGNKNDAEAISSYETALAFFSHPLIMGFLNLSIGRLYTRSNFDQAIYRLEIAIKHLNDCVAVTEKAILLIEIGWLCYRAARAKHKDAIKYFREAIDIIEKEDGRPVLAVGAYRGLGAVYNTQGDFGRSIKYLNKGIAISKKEGRNKEVAWDIYRLSVTLGAMNKWGEALHNLDESQIMAEELHDYNLLQQIYNQIGHIRKRQGKFEVAIEFHLKACDLQHKITDTTTEVSQAFLDRHLGAVYLEMHMYDRAVSYLLPAIEKFTRLGVAYQQPWNHAMLSDAMCSLGANESATRIARQALKFVEQNPNKLQEGIVKRSLGFALGKAGNLKEAREELAGAIKIFRKLDNKYYLAKSLQVLGEIELENHDSKQAEMLFNEALDLFTDLGAEADVVQVNRCLKLLY